MPKEKKTKTSKAPKEPQLEYNNYLLFLHKKKVELHINYGGNVLKLEGVLRSKASFDVQLILDNGEIVTINKAYIILVKPLS